MIVPNVIQELHQSRKNVLCAGMIFMVINAITVLKVATRNAQNVIDQYMLQDAITAVKKTDL